MNVSRVRLLGTFLLCALVGGVAGYQIHAQPAQAADAPYTAPSINHPRRIVLSLSERNPARVQEVINNVANTQAYYSPGEAEIALVVYGPGIHSVLKSDSTVKEQIAGLQALGIEILACNTTLKTIHKTAADLLPGVKVVPNGIPEIVERQARGWIYVRP